MAEFSFADFVVIAAGAAFVIGYLIINQAVLRLMLLAGTALYIWYYAIAAADPLWPAIWASAATGSANIVGLISLWFRNSRVSIPRRYSDIYAHFDILPPGDFRKLVQAASRVQRPAGYQLTQQGGRVNTMYYANSGY